VHACLLRIAWLKIADMHLCVRADVCVVMWAKPSRLFNLVRWHACQHDACIHAVHIDTCMRTCHACWHMQWCVRSVVTAMEDIYKLLLFIISVRPQVTDVTQLRHSTHRHDTHNSVTQWCHVYTVWNNNKHEQ